MIGKDVLIDENIILSNIKTLLGIKDNTEDTKLFLFMDEAEQMILDITNRTVLIEPMATILRDLTICIYNSNKLNSSTTGFATGAVKRVTEGEQTVEYETQTGGTTTSSNSTSLNSIPISILSRLARYKRNKVCMLYD